MAKAGAPKVVVASEEHEPGSTEPTKRKTKPAWRHSPFATAEIGIAAKAPEFLVHIAHAMAWKPEEDREYLLGQLLASAVLHGALISERVRQSWIEGLPHAQEENELLWVDINLRDELGTTYRWFADPTTRILIRKWRALDAEVAGVSARHCLQEFLARLPPAHQAEDRVRSFSEWAVMHWRLRLPPLLLDQALCRLPTTTINKKAWLEVLGRPPTTGTGGETERRGRGAGSTPPSFAASKKLLKKFNANGSIESRIFEEAWTLRSQGAFTRRKEKNFCIRQLTAALPDMTTGRQELAEWAIASLKQERARPSPKGFAPFTVRQWLYSILEGVYPDRYRRPDFQVSLETVSEDAKNLLARPGCRNKPLIEAAQKSLDRYVNSLKPAREDEGADEDLEALLGDAAGGSVEQRTTVSAKILSPQMFEQAVRRARAWSADDQAALIITLGFRAGLRFNEIAGLQVHDFIIKDNEIFELHVQRNRHRELKTFDSRRILPLDALLTVKEQQALRLWLEPRQEHAKQIGKNVYCFGPTESLSPIPDSRKFIDLILNDRKEECTEDRVQYNFAHLRHSFASYLLASLLLPEQTERSLLPEAFEGVVCWERRKVLSDRLLGKERLGQAALHAVSQIMGHTGVYRTLESYQHLLDLTLGLYVSRKALRPNFPPEVYASFCVNADNHEADVMRAFSNSGSGAPSTGKGSAYIVPFPPRSFPSPTKASTWSHLHLKDASALFGVAPLLPSAASASHKRNETGGLPRPWIDPGTAARTSQKLDWRSVWAIVTSSHAEAEQLRTVLRLCDKTLLNWRDRYQKIVTWGFKRQGQRRNEQACLARPIGAPALSVVEWMWVRRRSSEITASRRALLRTYLSNFNGEGFYSRMPSVKAAEEFAAFLRAVGVDGRCITIAQGRVSDFKDLKSGNISARNMMDGDTVLFKNWDASKACRRKGPNDRRPAVWISHIKYENASLGRSYPATRTTEKIDPPEKGRRLAQHKVNYAYRFALAMMAIVDDEIWAG